MRQVRWILQACHPGTEEWRDQYERVYSGWFHSTGNDEPSPTVIEAYNEAVKELDWLDVRLIQETRSATTQVLQITHRKEKKDG